MRIRAVASILVSSGKPIRAAAEMVTLALSVSYVSLAAAVVPVNNIRAEVFIPDLLPAYSDVTTSDQINRIAIGKGVFDIAIADEQVAIDFVRGVTADDVTVGDSVGVSPGKFVTDTATSSDESFRDIGKTLTDSVLIEDITARVITHPIDTDPTDADIDYDPVVPTDVAVFGSGKSLTDAATATDAVNSFEVAKATTDTATMADTAVSAVGKASTDEVTATDAINSFAVSQVSTDAVTAADTNNKLIGKVADTDSVTMADATGIDVSRGATDDTVTANDDSALAVGKNAGTDTVEVADAINSLAVGKGLTDAATASDSVSNTVDKSAGTDTVTMADSLASAWDVQRAVTDTVSMADSVSSNLQYSGAVNERVVNVSIMNGENTV